MPRYFFTTRWLNEIKEDPHGMYLPNVAAALSYAERRMGELQNESTCDPGPMMTVKDEFREDRFILTASAYALGSRPAYAGALAAGARKVRRFTVTERLSCKSHCK